MSSDEVGLHYGTGPARWVLAATIAGSGMSLLDSTVVGIALPSIGHDFHANVAALQWVATAYLLTLAGLLLLGGALGDRFGRKKIFLIGAIWFAVASLLCGLAPNSATLIFARGLQGIGGALLTPGSLAILQASFAKSDRSKAIGAWSGISGVATAIGPLVGGYFISAVSWRLIFFINVPIAIAIVAFSSHIPESKDNGAADRVDILGAALITGGFVGLTYGMVEAPSTGWSSPSTLASLIAGAFMIVIFVIVERRTPNALLPPTIFRSRQFTVTNLVTFVVYGALGGAFFLLPVDLEQVSHYSPVEAGLALFPVTVLMLLLSPRSGALAARIGPRAQMSIGPVLVGAGLALLARIGGSGDYLTKVLPAALVFGLGLCATVAPLTSTVLGAAPPEHSGIASAVNNDVARTASLVAVAALPPLVGLTGSSYLHPLVFSRGFHHAVLICAVFCVAGGVLSAFAISNNPPAVASRDDVAAL